MIYKTRIKTFIHSITYSKAMIYKTRIKTFIHSITYSKAMIYKTRIKTFIHSRTYSKAMEKNLTAIIQECANNIEQVLEVTPHTT